MTTKLRCFCLEHSEDVHESVTSGKAGCLIGEPLNAVGASHWGDTAT